MDDRYYICVPFPVKGSGHFDSREQVFGKKTVQGFFYRMAAARYQNCSGLFNRMAAARYHPPDGEQRSAGGASLLFLICCSQNGFFLNADFWMLMVYNVLM